MVRRMVCLGLALMLALAMAPAMAAKGQVSSVESFVSAFVQGVDNGALPFSVFCTQSVYETFFGADDALLAGLYSCCGITSFSYTAVTERSGVTVQVAKMEKYAGREIMDAVRAGTVDRLTAREQAALSAAMQITGSVSGTPLEKERQFHDWLCDHVTYTKLDGPRGENDSAIGALLNGQADCDGYADAFYLLCMLSGIECRHIHGAGTDEEGYTGSHMWNAVRLDNRWVMVDVTWDDGEDSVSYMYFNVGGDRMAVNHTWESRALPFAVAGPEDTGLKPAGVYTAAADSWDQVEERLADALSCSCTHCQLQVSVGLNVTANLDRLSAIIYAAGVEDYRWHFARNYLEIILLQQHANYRRCATEAEAVAFINSFAGAEPPAEIKLGFTQSLGAQLFADGHSGLRRLLARTRLAHPDVYSYSDDSQTVILRDLAFVPPLAEVRSFGELQTFLRGALSDRPRQLTFLADSSLRLSADIRPVSDVVYRCGVSEGFTYVITGDVRVTLSGLTYHDWFAYCETEEDVRNCLQEYRWAACPGFTVYCSDTLYRALSPEGGSAFFRLLREAGFEDASLSSSDTYCYFTVSAGF